MKTTQDKTKEYRNHEGASVSFRAADNGEGLGTIEGHVAVFDKKSNLIWGFREIIKVGAFTETIKQDDVRALVDHEPGKILGRNTSGTLRMKEDKIGLHVSIDLPDTQAGRDIKASMQRGDITGGSFGFRIEDDEWKLTKEEELHIIRKVSLFDVSIVAYPAYPDTELSVRSETAYRQSKEEYESSLKEATDKLAHNLREMRIRITEAAL